MFASLKQAKSPEGTSVRSDIPPGRNFATEHNALWHSLALRPAAIQLKLMVSQPGDPDEREADRIADQVMRAPGPQLQRACACGGGCPKCQTEHDGRGHLQTKHIQSNHPAETVAPPVVHEALHSSGQPLDSSTRSFMEMRFGQDFGRVRVHADGEAADGARSVRARAFTVGRDIVFGSGEYKPATLEGGRLLAHELAHVAQQSRGSVAPPAPTSRLSNDLAEQEVEANPFAHLSSIDQSVQRDAAGATGSKPAAPTEHVAGLLWATDEKGTVLLPSLEDISQGGVSDCFLFAAMAALVNTDPYKIFNMIADHGDDTYTVTFKGIGFLSSAQQKVTADFQVGKHGNVTGRKAIWPLIIEKAYAQQKGGMDKLEKGGNPGTAVQEMLNEGPSRFDPRKETKEYIMGKVVKAKEKKWPMTILAPKDGATKDKKEMADNTPGLHFWHSYAITDVDAVNNRIKLFNPWGHDQPNGDGWMDVEHVRKFFIEVDIND